MRMLSATVSQLSRGKPATLQLRLICEEIESSTSCKEGKTRICRGRVPSKVASTWQQGSFCHSRVMT